MWFKVTVASDGAIRSCDMVSGRQENGDYVYYVEADSKSAAVKAAKYLHFRALRQAVARRAEAGRLSAGLCRHCGELAAPGRTYCARHLEYKREHKRRQKPLRPARVTAPPKPSERTEQELAAAYQAHLDYHRAWDTQRRKRDPKVRRSKVLREVLAEHMRRGAGFHGWLVSEIAKCEGQPDQAVAAE